MYARQEAMWNGTNYVRTAIRRQISAIEWPTLLVAILCYAGFFGATGFAASLGPAATFVILTLALTLYSSFSHEVLHGHPFKSKRLNEALVFPALGLLIPYLRFRDTHLAHHHDPALTDPYDDPETNFVDPVCWQSWCRIRRSVYVFNNTLLGRITIGPLIGLITFYAQDFRAIARGDKHIALSYAVHMAGWVPVGIWLFFFSETPFWLYILAVYASHSILKIRTFLEHRAHQIARCRSVIIERQGLLSFLFLNNNLHAVHHARPRMPWYRLPSFYKAHKSHFLSRNGNYLYRSYQEIFMRYFLRTKDAVPHSLWASPNLDTAETTDLFKVPQ